MPRNWSGNCTINTFHVSLQRAVTRKMEDLELTSVPNPCFNFKLVGRLFLNVYLLLVITLSVLFSGVVFIIELIIIIHQDESIPY